MSFFRKLLKDSFETTLKLPNANATNVAAVHTSTERMYDHLPHQIGSRYLTQSWPMLCLQEFTDRKQMSRNLDLGMDKGCNIVKFFRIGGILVIVTGGLIVWRRIRNWNGNYCGWFQAIDCFLDSVRRWFFKKGTPASADAYKNLVESFLMKGELTNAKLTLDRMIERHHIPDQRLFKSVMEKLLVDCRVQLASKVMKNMLELGVVGDTDLVAEILKALLWRGQVRKALNHIEMLIENDSSPNFNRLLAFLCVEEKTLAARKLLEYGFARDCHITGISRLRVFDALVAKSEAIHAYCLMDKGVITDCGRSRYEVLIEMLDAQGYTEQAKILSSLQKILW